MSKKTGGRPRKTKGLIDVARWMPQMKRACSRKIVLDQLDQLETDVYQKTEPRFGASDFDLKGRIEQIKKDVASIKL
tara:strand:+ start:238 stop:468 length:231 start_codon:yes stop_codon:yes gene_type:complete